MTPQSGAPQNDRIVVHVDAELREIVPGYLSNRQADLQALREALARGDYEAIRIVGHSMKGSGGGYGFDALSEIGSALEQAAKAGDPEAIRRSVGELSTYLARVEVVYK